MLEYRTKTECEEAVPGMAVFEARGKDNQCEDKEFRVKCGAESKSSASTTALPMLTIVGTIIAAIVAQKF